MDKGVVAQGVVARYGVVAGKMTELAGIENRRSEHLVPDITHPIRCRRPHILKNNSESLR